MALYMTISPPPTPQKEKVPAISKYGVELNHNQISKSGKTREIHAFLSLVRNYQEAKKKNIIISTTSSLERRITLDVIYFHQI